MKKDLLHLRKELLKAGLRKEASIIEGFIKGAAFVKEAASKEVCDDSARFEAKSHNRCSQYNPATKKYYAPKSQSAIGDMQTELNKSTKLSTKMKVDGYWGSDTDKAVKAVLGSDYKSGTHTVKDVMRLLRGTSGPPVITPQQKQEEETAEDLGNMPTF